MYSPEVIDHFEHPRNSGLIENPDASVQLENPVCGDVLKLMARIERSRISEIRFLAKGCVPAIACGSAISELALGKTLDQVAAIGKQDLTGVLGSLPEASTHASHLALDALNALIARLNGVIQRD